MTKRVYWIFVVAAVLLGVALFMMREQFSSGLLFGLTMLPFFLLTAGVHGVLAHSVKSSLKGNLIFYPVLMGVIFSVIAFLYIFFIMRLFCPGFMD
jgi:hypothetical protein